MVLDWVHGLEWGNVSLLSLCGQIQPHLRLWPQEELGPLSLASHQCYVHSLADDVYCLSQHYCLGTHERNACCPNSHYVSFLFRL